MPCAAAAAALCGRIYRVDLESQAAGANPLKVPTLFPWAIIRRGEKKKGETPEEKPEPPTKP